MAAPSKLLRPSGEWVKTDRRYAILLARLARNNDIVADVGSAGNLKKTSFDDVANRRIGRQQTPASVHSAFESR